MKKCITFAIIFPLLAGCYTPLNNSGVSTTKPWLEIPGKKLDFDGKQYDSCYQFNLHFWPQEAEETISLKEACISGCCWRSEKEEVVLDFNKNFDRDLALRGRARKYTPGKITLQITHSNLLNTTKVSVSPHGAIANNGLVKLSYKEYENPTRLAQLENSARQQTVLAVPQPAAVGAQVSGRVRTRKTKKNAATKQAAQTSPQEQVKALFQQQVGTKVDSFFYQMDKTYKKQGAVFLLSERLLHVSPADTDGVYTLSCQAKARTGLNPAQLRASTFSCGMWAVELAAQHVWPLDKRAELVQSIP